MKLDSIRPIKIHFLGISGEGISGLAEFAYTLGHTVTGYDKDVLKPNAMRLSKIIPVTNKKQQHIDTCDLIVHSNAFLATHPILKNANKKNIPTLDRADFLIKYVIPQFKFIIGITGCNGKTSTTNMASSFLAKNDYPHCSLIGYCSLDFGSNLYIYNQGNNSIPECLILEIDESDPKIMYSDFIIDILIVTNIGYDHSDIYKNSASMFDAYRSIAKRSKQLIAHCSGSGILFNKNVKNVHSYCNIRGCVSSYNHSLCHDIVNSLHGSNYNITYQDQSTQEIKTSLIGVHNALNGTAIALMARILKISNCDMRHVKGVKRRFELISPPEGFPVIIDDYAVHNDGVNALLQTVKSTYPYNIPIISIFEPHRYSRLELIRYKLIECLSRFSDHTFITDMFEAGESSNKNYIEIYKDFTDNFVKYSEDALLSLVYKNKNCILIFMGAGNSSKIAHSIVNKCYSN